MIYAHIIILVLVSIWIEVCSNHRTILVDGTVMHKFNISWQVISFGYISYLIGNVFDFKLIGSTILFGFSFRFMLLNYWLNKLRKKKMHYLSNDGFDSVWKIIPEWLRLPIQILIFTISVLVLDFYWK